MREEITIQTPKGTIKGYKENGVKCFLGIPYAESPIGDRRFKKPQIKQSWNGTLNASKFSPVFMQRANRVAEWIGSVKEDRSEDALTMNIFVPEGDGPFPVLLWIHGGAWFSQGASQDAYNASSWSKNGQVIIVTINYRLGPWGFMYYPGLIEHNLGFKDCICALDMLREIISSFNGDVNNITVGGQSAGGYMTYMLIADPNERKKFHKAIPMSAPMSLPLRPSSVAAAMADTIFEHLKINPHNREEALQRLKDLPASDFLDASDIMARTWMPRFKNDPDHLFDMPWIPTDEKDIGFEQFLDDIVSGLKERSMPVLFGSVLNEFSFCSSTHDLVSDRCIGRVMFEDYCYRIIEQSGVKAYAYLFTWGNKEQPAYACHCSELPVLFDTWKYFDGSVHHGTDPKEMKALSLLMQNCWSRFMYSGKPDDDQIWPEYNEQSLQVKKLDGHDNAIFKRY